MWNVFSSQDGEKMEAEEARRDAEILSEFPPLDEATLERCRTATAADIDAVDREVVVRGMNLFFNNEFSEAESLFQQHYKRDPLCASAFGTLGTMRAMLSMEPQDIDAACRRLVFAWYFGKSVLPQRSTLSSVTSAIGDWWYARKPERLSTAGFRAHVVMAEAEMLRANLLLMEDTLGGYFKAGLALRRAYNIYDSLQRYVAAYPKDHGADSDSLHGMHFGLGVIHVVTSILPPKILAILKALGYMHDRQVGLDHLQTCLRSRTLRSPLASLFLLAFHGLLPSFATLITEANIPIAEQVIHETLAVYPKSIIHLWITGRVQRLKREVSRSIDIFSDCVAHSTTLQSSLPQLKHFAMYDLALSYLSKGQWEGACRCFEALERESVWSRKFYAYAQGCCLDMLRRFDEAAVCYFRSSTSPSTKLGGKVISVDQFVNRRTELMFRTQKSVAVAAAAAAAASPKSPKSPKLSSSINLNPVPAIELAMIFNMLTQTETEDLGAMREMVNVAIDQFAAAHKLPVPLEDGEGVVAASPSCAAEADLATPAASGADTDEGDGDDDDDAQSQQQQEDGLLKPLKPAELEQVRHEGLLIMVLLRANLNRELGRFDAAELGYETLRTPFLHLKFKKVEFESWLPPHALYEHAVLKYRAGDVKGCVESIEALKKKFGGLDFNFEMQLQFRLHLTKDMLARKDVKK